jgi:hypothetical protein
MGNKTLGFNPMGNKTLGFNPMGNEKSGFNPMKKYNRVKTRWKINHQLKKMPYSNVKHFFFYFINSIF